MFSGFSSNVVYSIAILSPYCRFFSQGYLVFATKEFYTGSLTPIILDLTQYIICLGGTEKKVAIIILVVANTSSITTTEADIATKYI